MNSRGTLISQRMRGETLATSDREAMTPTVQPAVAGTHRYREFGWLPERGPKRDVASVTDREDMPLIREIHGEAPRATKSGRPSLADGRNARRTPIRPQKCWKTPHGC